MSKTRKTAGKTAKSSYGTAAEIVPYQLDGGKSIPVKLDRETVWLTPDQMAVLFDCSRSNVVQHVKVILTDGELDSSTCQNFLQVAANGKTYRRAHYNLEMIISVGFRVNSKRGIAFRRFANGVIMERIAKAREASRVSDIERRVLNVEREQSLVSGVFATVGEIVGGLERIQSLVSAALCDARRITRPYSFAPNPFNAGAGAALGWEVSK